MNNKKYNLLGEPMDADAGERGWMGTVVIISAVDERISKRTNFLDGPMDTEG